jgi:hypothetical protein
MDAIWIFIATVVIACIAIVVRRRQRQGGVAKTERATMRQRRCLAPPVSRRRPRTHVKRHILVAFGSRGVESRGSDWARAGRRVRRLLVRQS